MCDVFGDVTDDATLLAAESQLSTEKVVFLARVQRIGHDILSASPVGNRLPVTSATSPYPYSMVYPNTYSNHQGIGNSALRFKEFVGSSSFS